MAECFLEGAGVAQKIAAGCASSPSASGTVNLTSYGFTEAPIVIICPTNLVYGGSPDLPPVAINSVSATEFTFLTSKANEEINWIAVGK